MAIVGASCEECRHWSGPLPKDDCAPVWGYCMFNNVTCYSNELCGQYIPTDAVKSKDETKDLDAIVSRRRDEWLRKVFS